MDFDKYLPDTIRRRYSLKLFGVSLLIVSIIVAFSVVVSFQVSDRVTERQMDSLEANAELEAKALEQWIDGEQNTVQQLSNHQGVVPEDAERTRTTLMDARSELPTEVARMSLVERSPEKFSTGENETIVASTDRALEGARLQETNIDWKPDVGYNFEAEDDVILSWVYMDGDNPSVAIASPTPDGEHVVVAEYRTNVRAEEFTSVIDETETVVLGGFTAFVLFDANRSNVMTRYEGDRRNTTIGSRILDNDPSRTLSGSVMTDDKVKGYHSVPGEEVDWVVVKEVPQSSALALTAAVQSDLGILLGMLFVGFVFVGVAIQRGPIRSIQRLATQANAISKGDLDVEIEDEGRIDEIGELREAFRNTKEYFETITKQSGALSRQEFDADVLDEEIPGQVGDSMAKMRTDLERFIDEIERERERYTTLVEQSSDGIVVVQEGECVFVNDRFVEITGYDREAIVDSAFAEFVAPEDRELVRERYEQRMRGESPPDQYEINIETSTGNQRIVELSISRIERDGSPAALANVRDLTERTQLERTYRELFENVADGLVIHEPDTGKILDVNEPFCEMNGYESSDLVGESIGMITPTEGEHSVEAAQRMIRLAQEEGPQLFEWHNEDAAGNVFPVEVHLRVAEIQGETRVLGSIREITDRKRRERAVQALQDATERMQTAETAREVTQVAVEAASEALELPLATCWLHDDEKPCLEPVAATEPVNDVEEVPEIPADRYEYEVFQHGEITTYTPSEHAAENPLETGVLLPLGEHGIIAAGRHKEVMADEVIIDIAGALAEHTTTALGRIERERELRDSEQRFRLIAERIDEVIYLATQDFSKALYVNPAYETVWGQSVDELYDDAAKFIEGIDHRDREAVESDVESMIAEIQRGEHADSYSFEYRVRRPDGEVSWVNATGYPVELSESDGQFVGIVEDITERKRREQRLEVFNRLLRHNLRNQLDVIKSHAEFLTEQTDSDHSEQILRSAERLDGIGNRARTIDRIMSRELQTSEFDVSKLVESVLEEIETDDRGIAVTIDLPESSRLVTDQRVLEALLESAIENAVEYAESTVDVILEEHPDSYTVVVEDDGPGIPEDELVAIDTGTETDLQHSRGLGLWQLQWGVNKLNGTLSFETAEGTSVRITVPTRDHPE